MGDGRRRASPAWLLLSVQNEFLEQVEQAGTEKKKKKKKKKKEEPMLCFFTSRISS